MLASWGLRSVCFCDVYREFSRSLFFIYGVDELLRQCFAPTIRIKDDIVGFTIKAWFRIVRNQAFINFLLSVFLILFIILAIVPLFRLLAMFLHLSVVGLNCHESANVHREASEQMARQPEHLAVRAVLSVLYLSKALQR